MQFQFQLCSTCFCWRAMWSHRYNNLSFTSLLTDFILQPWTGHYTPACTVLHQWRCASLVSAEEQVDFTSTMAHHRHYRSTFYIAIDIPLHVCFHCLASVAASTTCHACRLQIRMQTTSALSTMRLLYGVCKCMLFLMSACFYRTSAVLRIRMTHYVCRQPLAV